MSVARAASRLLIIIALGVGGCGGGSDGPSGPDDAEPLDPVDPPPGSLDCQARQFPCSLSEVPLAVLERSTELADDALAMLEGGATMESVASSLRSLAGMAEVEADAAALRFRLAGGRSMWILRRPVPGDEPPEAAQNARRDATAARDVVAVERKQKKALVLSPVMWAFGPTDDGPAVAAILEQTRGYENGVTFRSNAEPASAEVGIDSFRNWDDYQVIHVSTHGSRLCTGADCQAVIVAGSLDGEVPQPGGVAVKAQEITTRGVELIRFEGEQHVLLALTADFFADNYADGLPDTFIFFNACEVQGTPSDLVDALHTPTTVVLGWDEVVESNDAAAAAVALYGHLSNGGYAATVAFDKLGGLRTGTVIGGSGTPDLILSGRTDGHDLRIRDVVLLLDPFSAQELTASSVIPVTGIADDGVPDAAPWLVRVDGVPADLAGDMTVHVTIDGTSAEPVMVSSGEVGENDSWLVKGVVQLPYDLTEDRAVPVQARTDLYSGGESEHATTATLTGDTPLMGNVWQFEATHTSGWSGGIPHTPYTATASLTLEFEPGQDLNEPQPRYIITGGSVSYSYSHTYYSCTYSAPVVTFDVTAEHAGTSFLAFHTETTPATYRGVLHTQGPDFVVTESCGEGSSTRTHRATNTWLLLDPADRLPLSGEGTISGTYRNENPNGFYHESVYTITRVR